MTPPSGVTPPDFKPVGTDTKPPAIPDFKPAPPEIKPPSGLDVKPPVGTDTKPPSILPIEHGSTGVKPPQPDFPPLPDGKGPKPEIKPPTDVKPPVFTPPPGGTGATTGFTKPAGATEVKPNETTAFAPKTTYDVDVYDPKLNDSYESISQEFYNDKRFANALKAYNQNAPLQGGRYVNVPPLHILKRQFAAPAGGGDGSNVRPVGASGGTLPPAASPEPQWGASPKAKSFTVPAGGMTLPQVAKQVYGTEQRWRELYDLNQNIPRPDAVLPAGTEVKLP